MHREGTDWQSVTHQSYFMDCLCFSALLIKYLLLGNALPVRPRWLVIISSPWLWNLSCRSNAANCCSLPRQIFHQLPALVEGDNVPLGCRPLGPAWLRWVCCQPWGSKPWQLLLGEDPLSSSVLRLSTWKPSERCWNWKRTNLLLVWTGAMAFN